MAKVYFYYSAMNAGKSTVLLQASYNYQERGLRTLLLTPAFDTRSGHGRITSRIGLSAPAATFHAETDLLALVATTRAAAPLACVLVDEAQFLSHDQVAQLCRLADEHDLPALCYGLRTDFQGNLFPGSAALLGWADDLIELKTMCHCGRKATMTLRVDASGQAVFEGAQVEIGGNERYVSVCRRHHRARQPYAPEEKAEKVKP